MSHHNACMYMYTCMVYVYVCMYVCMYVCICIHVLLRSHLIVGFFSDLWFIHSCEHIRMCIHTCTYMCTQQNENIVEMTIVLLLHRNDKSLKLLLLITTPTQSPLFSQMVHPYTTNTCLIILKAVQSSR